MRQQVRLQSIRFPRTIVYAGIALMCSGIVAPIAAADSPSRAERVVILVWDGLRPDTVNEQDTPALCRLADAERPLPIIIACISRRLR